MIRDKRKEKKYSREKLSKKLDELSKKENMPGVFNITVERIGRIEARESAELSLREAIAIAKALKLRIGELIAEEYYDLLEDTEVGTYAQLRNFKNDEELFSYLCEVEAQGRIGIFHDFPSSVYYIAEIDGLCQHAMKRAEILKGMTSSSSEYYTLKSLLLFAFSEVGEYTTERKRMIVEKIIESFKDDLKMHLCFFDSIDSKIGDSFPDMEIVVSESLLIVDMPVPSHSILEIKNKRIVKIIDAFFRNRNSFIREGESLSIRGRDAIRLLEILKKCIERLLPRFL